MIKTLIRITFQVHRPWAVGTVGDWSDEVRSPMLVDFRTHRPHLPATSLVGALRVHLRRRLGRESEVAWLGPEPQRAPGQRPRRAEDRHTTVRTASPLQALGTRVSTVHSIDPVSTTRIDAVRGAAFTNTLRTEQRAKLSEDLATVDWFLSADQPVPPELLRELGDWQFFVGRGRSKGLGLFRVDSVQAFTLDLDQPGDLTFWLTKRHQWLAGETLDDSRIPAPVDGSPPQAAAFERTYAWRVAEPIAVRSDLSSEDTAKTRYGREIGSVPDVRRDGQGRPIIPGTTWRGVFRHRLEFILRSVGSDLGIVDLLFGTSSDSSTGEQLGRRGMLRFTDSTLCGPGGKGDATTVERSHVAIDRITGGAAAGLLFRVKAVAPDAECTLLIEADWSLPAAVTNLLDHVARDLHDGLIGVGGLTTRGYGSLKLQVGVTPKPIRLAELEQAVRELQRDPSKELER